MRVTIRSLIRYNSFSPGGYDLSYWINGSTIVKGARVTYWQSISWPPHDKQCSARAHWQPLTNNCTTDHGTGIICASPDKNASSAWWWKKSTPQALTSMVRAMKGGVCSGSTWFQSVFMGASCAPAQGLSSPPSWTKMAKCFTCYMGLLVLRFCVFCLPAFEHAHVIFEHACSNMTCSYAGELLLHTSTLKFEDVVLLTSRVVASRVPTRR